jgi:hypothetical protein
VATETLKIVITADNKGALTSLQQTAAETDKFKLSLGDLNTRLSLLKERLNQATEPARIAKLGGEIKVVTLQIEEQKAAFAALGAEVDKAGAGMAGGLNKAYSGLKTIANILPGIGIAGIFGLALGPLFEYLQGLTGVSDELKKVKEDQEKFNDGLDKETGAAKKTGFELKAYISIAADATKSLEERNQALKTANEIYGHHNQALTLANINTKEVKDQVEGYTQALIANAIASKYGDKIADLYYKQNEAAREYGQSLKELNFANELVRKSAIESVGKPIGAAGDLQTTAYITQRDAALQKATKATENYKKQTLELAYVTGDYVKILGKANELNTKFGETDKPKSTGGMAKDYNLDYLVNKFHQSHKLEGLILPTKTEAEQELKQYLNDVLPSLERSRKKDVLLSMGGASAVEELQGRGGGKSNALSQYDEATGKKAKALEEFNLALKDTEQIMGVVGPQIDNLFAAMQSGVDLGTALSDMFNKLAQDIAKAAIKALLFQIILSAVSGGGAAPAGAGGGFGDVFFKLLGLGGGHAKGGVVTGPQGGHIELLHGTEAILTPAQMSGLVRNSMNAGAITSMGNNAQEQGGQQGEFLLRGNDLVLALQRSNVALNLRRGS